VTAYRLDHAGTRSNVGVPVASALTISPRGEVFDGPVATEPGSTGEHAIMIWHQNVVDEALAAFLIHRGQGHRLRPIEDSEPASPRTDAQRVATPKHIRDWYAAEVAAGRIIPPEEFPPPAVRRQLREAQRLARPAVAAQLGITAEGLRPWETGDREPQGDNRAAYLALLTSWANGPQKPAEDPARPQPEPEPQWQPGPLTYASRRDALAAAAQRHRARVARTYGRPG
jgi:DNA-binding transcriptional regulator YiaG